MKRLLALFLALFLILPLFGCTYSYTPDLRGQLLLQCEEGAKKWISTIDGASFHDGDLMGFFRICTDAMEGTFDVGDKNYQFNYLSATDEFYTTMYDELLIQKALDEITAYLDVPISSTDYRYSTQVEVTYNMVSNQKGNKETELSYTEASKFIYGCKPLITEQDYQDRYNFLFKESGYGDIYLIIVGENVDELYNKLATLEFIEKYPKVEIYFTDVKEDSACYKLKTHENGADIILLTKDDKGQ